MAEHILLALAGAYLVLMVTLADPRSLPMMLLFKVVPTILGFAAVGFSTSRIFGI